MVNKTICDSCGKELTEAEEDRIENDEYYLELTNKKKKIKVSLGFGEEDLCEKCINLMISAGELKVEEDDEDDEDDDEEYDAD